MDGVGWIIVPIAVICGFILYSAIRDEAEANSPEGKLKAAAETKVYKAAYDFAEALHADVFISMRDKKWLHYNQKTVTDTYVFAAFYFNMIVHHLAKTQQDVDNFELGLFNGYFLNGYAGLEKRLGSQLSFQMYSERSEIYLAVVNARVTLESRMTGVTLTFADIIKEDLVDAGAPLPSIEPVLPEKDSSASDGSVRYSLRFSEPSPKQEVIDFVDRMTSDECMVKQWVKLVDVLQA